MRKILHRPKNAVTLTTYAELVPFAQAFARGHLNLLILIGNPGLQKSRLLYEVLGDSACWLEGTATPFGIYRELWNHRDKPVVLDDLDGLYANPAGIRLLKCLCQTEEEKKVAWHTDARSLVEEGIPREFRTRSKVAIIANCWRTLNTNVQALEDRGHVIFFQPTALEVHQRTACWFWNQEILDFLGEHLHLIAEPSMRHYVTAAELKQAGLDWRGFLLGRILTGPTLLVAKLKSDPSFTKEEDRAAAFVAAGGGCRATYFNHARKLQPVGQAPRIVLKSLKAPAAQEPKCSGGVLDLLQARFGRLGNG